MIEDLGRLKFVRRADVYKAGVLSLLLAVGADVPGDVQIVPRQSTQ